MAGRRERMVAPRPKGGNAARAPRREELASSTRELIKAGRWYKADVYALDLGCGPVVVKDFAAKPALVRLIGRIQIGHECRAYEWLGPMPGIPVFHGRVDAHALAVERIEGVELTSDSERFARRRQLLHQLREVAGRFLAAGFFHLDFRGRHNVMLTRAGEVVLLDLAGSAWVDPHGSLYGIVRPCQRRFYRNLLQKWRKLLSPGRSARDEKRLLARLMMALRMPHKAFSRRRPTGGGPAAGDS